MAANLAIDIDCLKGNLSAVDEVMEKHAAGLGSFE